MPSCAKVLMADMRHMSSAKATDMAAAKTAAKATDVTSTEAATKAAAHVTAAEAAAHVTATKAATHMAPTATTAAACLCTGGKKAAGQYRGCQNHHYSSSHETLMKLSFAMGGLSATLVRRWHVRVRGRQRHDRPEVGMPTRRLD